MNGRFVIRSLVATTRSLRILACVVHWLFGRSAAIDFRSRRYRPHLRVAGGEHLGVVFVDGPASPVSPGEIASGVVSFLYMPDVSYADLRAGCRFDVLEGGRVIATGVVTRCAMLSGFANS